MANQISNTRASVSNISIAISILSAWTLCIVPAFSHDAEWQKLRQSIDEEEIRQRYVIAEKMYLQGLDLSEKHRWPAVDTTELLSRFIALKLTSGMSEQTDALVKKMLAVKQQIKNPSTSDMDDALVAIHDVVNKYKMLLGTDDRTWCLYRVIEITDSAFQGKHRNLPWFCTELAGSYLGLGQTKDAIATLKRAEDYNRKLPSFTKLEAYRFHLVSARLNLEIKDYKQALANADKAIELARFARPEDAATPTILRGLALVGLKQDAEAKKVFTAAEPLNEAVKKRALPAWEPYRLTNLGLIRMGQKKYKEADDLFNRATISFKVDDSSSALYPDCCYVIRKRIETLTLLGKKSEAQIQKTFAEKSAQLALRFKR